MTKRLCLFAGYSSNNIIEDYVVYYLKELSNYADIYYCADCDMTADELLKIKPYVKFSVAHRHQQYDFGSWSVLFKSVPNLNEYDELILVNDSVFGPFFPLDDVFDKMKSSKVSAWSLCGNKFMMSFFVVLKRDVFLTTWFSDFITNIRADIEKNDIVRIYEKGISKIIEEHNLEWDCLFSKHNLKKQIKERSKFIKEGLKTIPLSIRFWHRYRTNKTRVYNDDFFILFLLGMPFIKKQAFSMNSNHFNILAPLFIEKYTNYDYQLIKSCLEHNQIKPINLSLFQRLKNATKKFIFEKKYKGKGIVYKVFKIKVYVKKHKLN